MGNLNKNIVTINGNKENVYDKAIFFIKPEQKEDVNTLDFVGEADKIINNYMTQAVIELQKKGVSIEIDEKVVKKNINKTRTKDDVIIDRILGFSILLSLVVMSLLIFGI